MFSRFASSNRVTSSNFLTFKAKVLPRSELEVSTDCTSSPLLTTDFWILTPVLLNSLFCLLTPELLILYSRFR